MGKLTGFATMYMRMPMSTSSLPIAGECTVDDKRITLKFPFTGIEFELPSAPKDIKDVEDTFKVDFKVDSIAVLYCLLVCMCLFIFTSNCTVFFIIPCTPYLLIMINV